MSRFSVLAAPVFFAAGMAQAEAPKVVADIAPVHSLVAQVMAGVGAPDLIVSPGASPHEYAMRPSQARALQEANIVFWTSPGLTPWLEKSLDALTQGAETVELIAAPGTMTLPFREGALFEAHDHDEHGEHGDDDHEGHDDHGDDHDEHDDHEGHAHEGEDPHAWLAPENAKLWLGVIAAELSKQDPENADLYAANAEAGRVAIDAAVVEVAAKLAPLRDRSFIVFHDAYQYFETSFDIPAAGAISVGDAQKPSPARLREIEERIAEHNVSCVLAEPQFNAALVTAITEGTEVRAGVMDPLGADLTPGPALYPDLIRHLGGALAACL